MTHPVDAEKSFARLQRQKGKEMKNIDAVEVDDDESEGNDLPISFGEADDTNVFRVDPATHKGATEAIADGAIAKSNIAAEVTITEVIAYVVEADTILEVRTGTRLHLLKELIQLLIKFLLLFVAELTQLIHIMLKIMPELLLEETVTRTEFFRLEIYKKGVVEKSNVIL